MLDNKEKLNIVDLLAGSWAGEEGKDYFKYLVQKYHGKLHVLTHPFFYEDDQENTDFQMAPGYARRRDIFIDACLKHSVPLVIFEQLSDVRKLPERIQGEGTIFLVKTPENKGKLFKHKNEWRTLMKIFNDAGVRHIISGGQFLRLDKLINPRYIKDPEYVKFLLELDKISLNSKHAKAWIERDILPADCAGSISRKLAISGFEVTLSPISSPDNYCDLIKSSIIRQK